MRVLLVSMPIEERQRFHTDMDSINYPLGLIYLYSSLEKAGHTVDMLFMNNDTYDNAANKLFIKLQDFKPDCVGFNVLTINRVSTEEGIKICEEEKVSVVLGGIHASLFYNKYLEKHTEVTVVIGEGEETFVELLSGKKRQYIKGIAYYNKKVVRTKERPLIEDLDKLPFPKHEYFFKEGNRTHAYLISSRGCPFLCSFCCLHTISKRKYRTRSVENVMAEIDYIIRNHPQVKTIEFSDDTLLLDINRAKLLMKAIITRGSDIKFRCSARFKPFDLELAKLMEKAGFHTIMFGLETGCRVLLKSIHKAITPEDVIETWKILAQTNINAVPFLIVGFPGETQSTVEETISLIKWMKLIKPFFIYDIGILLVYPNTEVYSIMKSRGCIDDSYWDTDKDIPMYTVEHDYNTLLDFKNQIIFRTMTYKDLLRFVASIILITIKHTEKPRFWKEKLLWPIIKRIVNIT